MTNRVQIGGAVISAAILARYYGHGGNRAVHDGIFNNEKSQAIRDKNREDFQYHIDPSEIPKYLEESRRAHGLVQLSYNRPAGYEGYTKLKDYEGNDVRVTDSFGLDATAYRKADGTILISVAGIETVHAGGEGDKAGGQIVDSAKDAGSAFDALAGRVSESTATLVEFAEKVAKQGKISEIAGHSLGAYLGMQLKAVGDKRELTTEDCKLYSDDNIGITSGLECGLKKDYGVTRDDLIKSFKNPNIVSAICGENSWNTMGVQIGVVLTATDPRQDGYKAYSLNLVPYRHCVKDFDAAYKQPNWFQGDNSGWARGPEYCTAITAGMVAGAFHPLGYALAAEPFARHAQGAIADAALGDSYKHMLEDLKPSVTEGLRGEKPNLLAYKHLNNLALELACKEGMDLASASDPDNLRLHAYDKMNAAYKEILVEKTVVEKFQSLYSYTKELGVKAAGTLLGVGDIAKLPVTQEDLIIQQTKAALKELETYEADYSAYEAKTKIGADAAKQASAVTLPKDVQLLDSKQLTPPPLIASASQVISAQQLG